MSTDEKSPRPPKLQEYLKVWGDSIRRVIQEVAGAPFQWKEISPEATRELIAALNENCISVQFEVSDKLSGNQGFVLSNKDAVGLSQMLLMEPQDGSAEMNDDRRDAVGEFFRQFAGAAASTLKSTVGGEVSFKWVGLNPFPGEPSLKAGFEWVSEGLISLTFLSNLDQELFASLSQSVTQAQEVPAPSPSPANVEMPPDPKLELLMDVELEVTLRFGERELALRDILELTAGSVVELNQHIQDPVELLVGSKVIARGEVVVVDGSYALRVIQIASPKERIESLNN